MVALLCLPFLLSLSILLCLPALLCLLNLPAGSGPVAFGLEPKEAAADGLGAGVLHLAYVRAGTHVPMVLGDLLVVFMVVCI